MALRLLILDNYILISEEDIDLIREKCICNGEEDYVADDEDFDEEDED